MRRETKASNETCRSFLVLAGVLCRVRRDAPASTTAQKSVPEWHHDFGCRTGQPRTARPQRSTELRCGCCPHDRDEIQSGYPDRHRSRLFRLRRVRELASFDHGGAEQRIAVSAAPRAVGDVDDGPKSGLAPFPRREHRHAGRSPVRASGRGTSTEARQRPHVTSPESREQELDGRRRQRLPRRNAARRR